MLLQRGLRAAGAGARALSPRARAVAVHALLSIALAAVLLVDPLVDRPSGLIKLAWFTRRPLSHGLDACSWDYEGSWRIASATGSPDPMHLQLSPQPVITCATVAGATANGSTAAADTAAAGAGAAAAAAAAAGAGSAMTIAAGTATARAAPGTRAVSFVADPFLFIPDDRTAAAAAQSGGASSTAAAAATSPGGGAAAPPLPWYAFYEMKNLARYTGEIGVALSYDRGGSWSHVGTALAQPFHLSYPLVLYDTDSGQYLMFPETSGARDGAIRIYATTPHAFPLGWRLVSARRPPDPGWPATRRWFQFGAAAKYVDTSPVRYDGRWWIFTSRVGTPAAGQPKYTLLLYTAETLLGDWTPHPAALAGVPYPGGSTARRLPFGIGADRATARNGGRPFVLDGVLYRWAQDCSRYYGEALVLLRATVANATHYAETVAVRYDPIRDGASWRAQRIHSADLQRLPDGSWVGLVDGDRYVDGTAHFLAREQWFVDLKARLLPLVVLQLALVLAAAAALSYVSAASGGGGGESIVAAAAAAAARLLVSLWCCCRCCPAAVASTAVAAVSKLRSVSVSSGGGGSGGSGGGGGGAGGGGAGRSPLFAVAVMAATAVAVSVTVMALVPWMVYCPSWPMTVRPLPGSPHFKPARPFTDPAAPYNVTVGDITVITGCSATFVDRLENLVGSLQYWAPATRLLVYDLGFTSEQLAHMGCWEGIELRRFPWERYPPHVREVSNYAFKGLVLRQALEEEGAAAVLWLDCGLEVRSPLTPFAESLAAHGHVSAQQSTSPGTQGWPLGGFAERHVAPFLNISAAEYARVKRQPFCAGGLQGFVRGSAAEALVLRPETACALDRERCIAPPGHSRDQHCYDQTAFTLLLRSYNFPSCLPRELACTSATHKTRYDPRQSSAPIVVASRRYRQPKPYRPLLRRRAGCVPSPAANPWPTVASEHVESSAGHASLRALAVAQLKALADFAVQAGCCLGLHSLMQAALWAQVLGPGLRSLLRRLLRRRSGGGVGGGGGGGTGVGGAAGIAVGGSGLPVGAGGLSPPAAVPSLSAAAGGRPLLAAPLLLAAAGSLMLALGSALAMTATCAVV